MFSYKKIWNFSSCVAVLHDPLRVVFSGVKRMHLPAWILQSTWEQMKVARYPHLSSSALVRTAILLPITLVSEFLTIFNATSSHNKQNYFSDSKDEESWGKSKEITPENIRRLWRKKCFKSALYSELLFCFASWKLKAFCFHTWLSVQSWAHHFWL